MVTKGPGLSHPKLTQDKSKEFKDQARRSSGRCEATETRHPQSEAESENKLGVLVWLVSFAVLFGVGECQDAMIERVDCS